MPFIKYIDQFKTIITTVKKDIRVFWFC